MSPQNTHSATVTKRVRWAFGLIVFGFLVIFARTVQIMVVDRARTLAIEPIIDGTQSRTPLPPADILDRRGQVMATSVRFISVCATPNQVEEKKRRSVARVVAAQLGMDDRAVLQKLRGDGGYAVIERGVSSDPANAIEALRIKGIYCERTYQRVYPLGPVACQVLGFREKSVDLRPLAGVELSQRHILDAQPGGPTGVPHSDTTPMVLTAVGLAAPRPGRTLVLTIDGKMQSEVEAVLAEALAKWAAKTVSATVMDANTGELLCVGSVPRFDPNHFERVVKDDQSRFAALPATRAWEPGSVCKVAVVAAGLESGIITTDTEFTCTGTRRVGGWTIGCWGPYRYRGHGTLTPLETLVHSCNMCASQISEALGADRVSKWFREFGLGQSTNSGLPGEATGRVPKPDEIDAARLATMGYGQGLQVTDLQMARFVAALANGGNLLRPRIVKAVRNSNGREESEASPEVLRRVLSPETAETVLGMMEEVVRRGTGRGAAIPGVRVAGKTGTAQKVEPGADHYADGVYLSSFVGVVGVGTSRPIVIMVSLDEPKGGATGGRCAAPLFRQVGEVVLRNLDARRAPGLPNADEPPVAREAQNSATDGASSEDDTTT